MSVRSDRNLGFLCNNFKGVLDRALDPEPNVLRPLLPHGMSMSSHESAESSEPESDSEAGSLVLPVRDPNAMEEIFADKCTRVRESVVFAFYRQALFASGRSRRSVSGSSGRLIGQLSGKELSVIRRRLDSEMPREFCDKLTVFLEYLDQIWRADFLDNDKTFIRALGSLEDPNKSELCQQFQRRFCQAARRRGFQDREIQWVSDVFARIVKYGLYVEAAELLARSLPGTDRNVFIEWISEARAQKRSQSSTG